MNHKPTPSASLQVICCDIPAPPLFKRDATGYREGYESDVARLIAKQLNLDTEFVYESWADFYPALDAVRGDMLLCGQGISAYRKTLGDFTHSYAIFDEAVMIKKGSAINSADDLKGKRVGAIENSINMSLAETFTGCITVPFSGSSDDVLADMVNAVRNGSIDAFVDDDVALVPLADADDLDIAFTVKTQNEWGIAIKKGQPDWLDDLNQALDAIKSNGELEATWNKWMPSLNYPF